MSDLGILGFGPGTADAALAELRPLRMAAGGFPDKVLPRIAPCRPRGIQTSLAREGEDKLRAAPSGTPEAAA